MKAIGAYYGELCGCGEWWSGVWVMDRSKRMERAEAFQEADDKNISPLRLFSAGLGVCVCVCLRVCVCRGSKSYTNTQKLQCQHYPGSFETCVWFAYAGPLWHSNCTMQYLSEVMWSDGDLTQVGSFYHVVYQGFFFFKFDSTWECSCPTLFKEKRKSPAADDKIVKLCM